MKDYFRLFLLLAVITTINGLVCHHCTFHIGMGSTTPSDPACEYNPTEMSFCSMGKETVSKNGSSKANVFACYSTIASSMDQKVKFVERGCILVEDPELERCYRQDVPVAKETLHGQICFCDTNYCNSRGDGDVNPTQPTESSIRTTPPGSPRTTSEGPEDHTNQGDLKYFSVHLTLLTVSVVILCGF